MGRKGRLAISLKGETHPHFVFIVWFNGTANPDAYRLFIVPAEVADCAAKEAHSFYHSHKTKKGETRKGVNRVVMFFEGNDSERSISRGFARKWAQYENAWHLLES